ncbi:ABC transporter ATP-binding protein [Ectobacillus sp. JY-23]|uniref:ABC transporter ATP-binding protein n=1 Tax=Ectobacillus sp. JY-23 TaxID=2933872 RepID=UPI001FF4F231|nr:ABC transporter ATP-binding protein [Ectobacillus sp. JY-23]UOY92851.1 ABC transporter ATP-binding protein [Ectobacillus sp. JY-23]
MLEVHIRSAGYKEAEAIITNVAFSVQAGELVALIGANGAGKSTTIKGILGMLPHMDGEVTVSNYAYVPEQPVYYDYLTLWEHMELLAATKELSQTWKDEALKLLHVFQMEESQHEYLGQFSKGMKQKAMLMLAFLAKPSIYIVDEPFIGLDPTAVRDFLKLLEEERKRGAGVLLCTHVLDTAERICERFLLVSKGTLLASGDITAIQQAADQPGESLLECFDSIVRRNYA